MPFQNLNSTYSEKSRTGLKAAIVRQKPQKIQSLKEIESISMLDAFLIQRFEEVGKEFLKTQEKSLHDKKEKRKKTKGKAVNFVQVKPNPGTVFAFFTSKLIIKLRFYFRPVA